MRAQRKKTKTKVLDYREDNLDSEKTFASVGKPEYEAMQEEGTFVPLDGDTFARESGALSGMAETSEDISEEEEAEEEALDELEAEELDMLTEDEAAESLPVDEVEELRQLRREAIELELGPDAVGEDEFVCSHCFLVKRITQLADKRKRLCRDCV